MTPQGTDEIGRLDRERRDADTRYNQALTALDDVIVASSGRELSREDFDRAASALLLFLQQITAFVESKDRQLDFEARARLAAIAQALEPVAELRSQVAVLQRATEALKRAVVSPQSSVASAQSSVVSPQSPVAGPDDDYKYVGFEDQFRGADDAIEERLRRYVPIFAGCADVLDIGCGRGE